MVLQPSLVTGQSGSGRRPTSTCENPVSPGADPVSPGADLVAFGTIPEGVLAGLATYIGGEGLDLTVSILNYCSVVARGRVNPKLKPEHPKELTIKYSSSIIGAESFQKWQSVNDLWV